MLVIDGSSEGSSLGVELGEPDGNENGSSEGSLDGVSVMGSLLGDSVAKPEGKSVDSSEVVVGEVLGEVLRDSVDVQTPHVARHVDLTPAILHLSLVFLFLTHLHDLIVRSGNLKFFVASLQCDVKNLHLEHVLGQWVAT